jgi:hypothetical protein
VVFAIFEFGFGEGSAGRGRVEGWSMVGDDETCESKYEQVETTRKRKERWVE